MKLAIAVIASTLLGASFLHPAAKQSNSRFFLGDSQEKVLEAMSSPPEKIENSKSGQIWTYKSTTLSYAHDWIEFRDGKVWEYDNSNGTLKLPTRKSKKFPAFGMNASEEEVLKSMAAPLKVAIAQSGDSTWTYKTLGYRTNEVKFENSHVVGWQDYDGYLAVSYTGSSPKTSSSSPKIGIDLGDTVDEVLSVMGTPSGVGWVHPRHKRGKRQTAPPYFELTWRKGSKEASVRIGARLDGELYFADKTISYDNESGILLVALTPNGLRLANNLLESPSTSDQTYVSKPLDSDLSDELRRYSVYERPSGYTSTSSAYYLAPNAFSAENGSYYGEISKITGLPKTIYVRNYFRNDGTYVQSHYRSKSR